MGKYTKKYLSLCMAMALTAAYVPLAGLAPTVKETDDPAPEPRMRAIASDYTSAGVPEEPFAMLTVNSSEGAISADGKYVGNSYGGVTVTEDGTVIINADGVDMTLDRAKELIGCETAVNKNGELVIMSPFRTARLIVVSDSEFDDRGAASVEEKAEGIYLLTYASSAEAYKAYLSLSGDSSIISAEPDQVCRTMENDAENEKFTIESWGLERIGAKEYCGSLIDEKGELPEVKVAVVDTGVYAEHKVFDGRLLDGGASFTAGMDDCYDDLNGHGSHCAGIICSATNDNVKILPVRVMDEKGFGTTLDIYCGMMYAIEQNVDIMSVSLGGYGKSPLFDEAILAAKKKDITVCIAAGNEAMDSAACCGSLSSNELPVVVSSLDEELNASYFSNYGATVDFAAPGSNIPSVGIKNETDVDVMSGTSMATPYVAAVFADVFSYNIDFTAEQAYDIVKANAVDLMEIGYDEITGWGLVNLKNMDFRGIKVDAPECDHGTAEDIAEDELFFSFRERNDGAEIYYTLDGSDPKSKKAVKYDGSSLILKGTTRVRAVALKDGVFSSETSCYFDLSGENELAFLVRDGVLVSYDGHAEVADAAKYVAEGKLPEFTNIAERAFIFADDTKEVILPDSVKTIGFMAFASATSIEKVTAKAENIGLNAFAYCDALREIDDDCIKTVGREAFVGCYSLESVNAKNVSVMSSYAFAGCSQVTSDSFDFKKLTEIGDYAFAESGISGDIDVSNAVKVGSGAFSNTSVSKVTLSERITELPEELFSGCRHLTELSAPSVTSLKYGCLSLNKCAFAEESKVKTDIDFSKIITAEPESMAGYVFDKPVSFDSLDPETYINFAAEAYGERITLPTITDVSCDSFRRIPDIPYSQHFNADVVSIPNAETLWVLNEIGFNVMEFGSALENIDSFNVTVGKVAVPSLDEAKFDRNMFNCEVTDKPFVFLPISENNGVTGDTVLVHPVFYKCDGSDFEWYIVDANRFKDNVEERELPDDFDYSDIFSEDYPFAYEKMTMDTADDLILYADEAGSFYYVLVQTKPQQAVAGCIAETVTGVNTVQITDGSRCEIHDWYTPNDELRTVWDLTFVPDKTSTYRGMFRGASVRVFEGSDLIIETELSMDGEFFVDMKKDVEYHIITTTPSVKDMTEIVGEGYSNVNNFFTIIDTKGVFADMVCLSEYADSILTGTWDFDGTFPYIPEFMIFDEETGETVTLEYGVDFTLSEEVLASLDFGEAGLYLEGTGNYYGGANVFFQLPYIVTQDVPFTSDTLTTSLFTPEKSGTYSLAIKPAEGNIDYVMKRGSFIHDIVFDAVPTVRYYVSPEEGEGYYVDLINWLETDKTVTSDRSRGVYEFQLEEGVTYEITTPAFPAELVVTQGRTIADLNIEYSKSIEIGGRPDVTVTDRNGTKLTEGTDYRFRVWNNEENGIAFGYLECMGDYAGALPMLMTAGECDYSVGTFNGRPVIDVELNKEFPLLGDMFYRVKLERITDVIFSAEEEAANFCSVIREGDISTDVVMLNNEPTPLSLEKGSYILDIQCEDDIAFIGGGYIIVSEDWDEEYEKVQFMPAVLKAASEKTNIKEVTLKTGLTPYDSTIIDATLEYEGRTLVLGEDYFMNECYGQIGINEISALAEDDSDFDGYLVIRYPRLAPEGFKVKELSSNKANRIKMSDIFAYTGIDDETTAEFTWTPEKEHYTISTSSYKSANIAVVDKTGSIIFDSDVNKGISGDLIVEAGREYYVFVNAPYELEFDLFLTSEQLMSECEIKYEPFFDLSLNRPTPEVTITDKDGKLLTEGVDYEFANTNYFNKLGMQRYIIRGMGDHTGEAFITVIGYTDRIPEDAEIFDVSCNFGGSGAENNAPGDVRYFRFTSDIDGAAEYRAAAYSDHVLGTYAKYALIYIYNDEGELVDIVDNIYDVTLEKGESLTLAVAAVNELETMEQGAEIPPYFMVSLLKDAPEIVTASTTASTDGGAVTTEPTTTTAAPDTTTTGKTTSDDTTTTTTSTTGTTTTTANTTAQTTASDDPTPTTTTAASAQGWENEQLPETGYSAWHSVIAAAALAMAAIGGLAAVESRKKEN